MRKLLLAAAGALCLTAPALADGAKLNGFYLAGEVSWTRVSNDDMIVATPIDLAGNPTGELVSMDFGTKPSYKVIAGYRHETWGDFSLSYWGYSHDTGVNVANNAGFLPDFANPFNGQTFLNQIDGRATLRTRMVDFTWGRQFAKTDKSEWDWSIGLRHWTLEQTQQFNGCQYLGLTCSYVGQGSPDPVTLYPYQFENNYQNSDSRAIGLTFGINARMHFTERFWASSSIKFAYLSGHTDAKNFDRNYYMTPPPDGATYHDDLSSTGKNRTFNQIEADARLNWNFVAGWNGFVGYQFKKLENAITTIGNGNAYNFDSSTHRHDLNMDGFVAGMSYVW
jgi:hypothetical protein